MTAITFLLGYINQVFVAKSMPSVISVCGAVIRWTLLFSDLSALSLIIAKVFYSTFDFLFR